MSYFNGSRQRGLKISTVPCKKHPNARQLLKLKEGITGQILPNKLSKNSLRLGSDLLGAHFLFALACFISRGKRLGYTTLAPPTSPQTGVTTNNTRVSISQKYFMKNSSMGGRKERGRKKRRQGGRKAAKIPLLRDS